MKFKFYFYFVRQSFSLLYIYLSGIIFANLANAQTAKISFERFSTEDGLPNTYVVDITQDQEGFIWLGTLDGLVKYDGYQYLTFRNIPGDSTSLSHNSIEAVYVDITGDLWVGTREGLNRYVSTSNCFHRYHPEPSNPNSLTPGQINTFAEDQSHNLWIGTQQGGLFRYNRESDQFTRFLYDSLDPNNLLEDQVRVLLADRNNYLWIGTGETFDPSITGGGLIRFDLSTGTAKRFKHDPANPNSLIDDRVSALLEDRKGVLWAGTGKSGLHYFDPVQEQFIRMMPDPDNPNRLHAPQGKMGFWSSCPHVRILHQDKGGAFWVGTFNGGINHFDPITGKLSHYIHDPDDPNSLANNMIFTLFEDRQERLWIGNLLAGYHKIEPSSHKFTVHAHDSNDPTSLSNNNVMGIYESPQQKGIIWLGTRGGGLNRMDLESGRFTTFRHNTKDENSISSDIVWTTFEDHTGTFWIGTEEGLDLLDRKTGIFSHIKMDAHDAESAISNAVIRLHEDRQNILWIGTWSGGIIRFDRNTEIFKSYDFSEGNQRTYYNSISLIHEDTEGLLWVGTWLGALYQYNRQKDIFLPRLEGFGAICLQEDSSGWFWIGTSNDGLLHFNPSIDSLEHFTTADGLPSNYVPGILEDIHGSYWISTGNGISKFDPRLKTFSNFDISDGLPANSYNFFSALKSSDGRLFFGGNAGLVSFLPDQVKSNPYPPDVIFCGLQIDGETFDLPNSKTKKPEIIVLSHHQNDLTFEYVGLHYTDPSKNLYQYRLEPYDIQWIDAGKQRTARYTNLDPGEYTFQVKASNCDGIWNELGTSVKITILPPWWARWWAYIIFAMSVIALVYFLRRYELNRLSLKHGMEIKESEARNLQELDHLKSKFFANISHEFRTPLTLILGPIEQFISEPGLEKYRKTFVRIKDSARRLLGLISQLLDLSRLEAKELTLEASQTDIVKITRAITSAFESMALYRKIKLNFQSSVEKLVVWLDRDRYEIIITNLLSNAFKFSKDATSIMMELYQKPPSEKFPKGSVEIKVTDQGLGIAEEKIEKIFNRFYQAEDDLSRSYEGSGIGLALVKELVDLHHGTIKVESKPAAGTVFTVELHLGKTHLRECEMVLNPVSSGIASTELSSIKNEDIIVESSDATEKPTILIVEDNTDMQQYISEILEETYNLTLTCNGRQGLQVAMEKIPDLILSDVMMPEMNGMQMCKKVKTDTLTSHIPVILLTARAGEESKLDGLETGADDYLEKPFSKKELLVRVRNLIEQRKLLRIKFSEIISLKVSDMDITQSDKSFLTTVINCIEKNITNENFSVDQLAKEIFISRTQLHRKLTALSGKNATEFVRGYRLAKAAELLSKKQCNVSQAAYETGFNSLNYFSKVFKEQFGVLPSEYAKN